MARGRIELELPWLGYVCGIFKESACVARRIDKQTNRQKEGTSGYIKCALDDHLYFSVCFLGRNATFIR